MTLAIEQTETGQDERFTQVARARLGLGKIKRGKATGSLSPKFKMPPAQNNGDQESHVTPDGDVAANIGEGGQPCAAHLDGVAPSPILLIQERHAQRVATIKAQIRIDNQAGALARRAMGWRFDATEAERKKVCVAAAKLVSAIQAGKPIDPEQKASADTIRPFCMTALSARLMFDSLRKTLEKEMKQMAISLPVWPWVEKINGFAELGLAMIVGEAGDLSNYSNPGKLWKRMGLAVFDGKSQRKSTNAEEAIAMGYNPRRRSAMWTITDSLLKHTNEYQKLYRERRIYECEKHPEFDKGIDKKTGKPRVTKHCDRRSRRYAEKRLLLHLWRAWRDATTQAT